MSEVTAVKLAKLRDALSVICSKFTTYCKALGYINKAFYSDICISPIFIAVVWKAVYCMFIIDSRRQFVDNRRRK